MNRLNWLILSWIAGSLVLSSSSQFFCLAMLKFSSIPKVLIFSSVLRTNCWTASIALSLLFLEVLVACPRITSLSISLTFLTFLFLMFFARLLYFRVFNVSSQNCFSKEIHAIITVLLFPPRDYFRIRVSLESRKGTNWLFFSARMLMHFPRVSRLLLMFIPSTNLLSKLFPAEKDFSFPARSTRNSLDSVTFTLSFLVAGLNCLSVSWKIAWEREETSFDLVAFMALCSIPYSRRLMAYYQLYTVCSESSLINTPRWGSSIICRGEDSSCSRSRMVSLYISQKQRLSSCFPLPLRALNTLLRVMVTTPGDCPSPNIVQVFPAPVDPQIRTVELNPASTLAMGEETQDSKSVGLSVDCERILSNWNVLSLS